MIFVQIGTNTGNDAFRNMVRDAKPSVVVLVEPNPALSPIIRENYKNIKNVFIETAAITAHKEEKIKLYIPQCDKTGRANNGCYYNHEHFSILPMNDWGEELIELEATALTFDELCDKYNLKHIDFLQIDTEGYDSQILQSIDYAKINISRIKYENWNFRIESYSRHNEKARFYGINGQRHSEMLLTNNGYRIERHGTDNLAIKEL